MSITINPLAAEGGIDGEGNRTYAVTVAAWVDDATIGPMAVRTALAYQVSSYYSFFNEYDLGAFFNGVSTARKTGESQDGRLEWRATVNYSTKPKRKCADDVTDDPLLQPEVRSGSFVASSKMFQKDIFGQPFTNSAGAPYTDVPMDDSRPSLVVKKNFPLAKVTQLSGYKDAVNVDTFYGQPKRTWKMKSFNWDEVFLGSCVPYAACTLSFEHNPDTWDFERVDAGFYELINNNVVAILDDINNLPVTEPYPLDGTGQKAVPGVGGLQYMKARGYPELPYSQIGIRTTL